MRCIAASARTRTHRLAGQALLLLKPQVALLNMQKKSSVSSQILKDAGAWVPRGRKNESSNFQEPRALECVSGHGELEYALSSVFDFGPASVGWPTGQGPIGPFWEKF